MEEIDIYIKVLEEYNCLFDDEYSRASSDNNYLVYNYQMDLYTREIRIYFNLKSGKVTKLFFDYYIPTEIKKSIESSIQINLRDYIINHILSE